MCEDALEHCFSEPRSALLISQPVVEILGGSIDYLSVIDPSRHREADLVQLAAYSTLPLYEYRQN